MKRLFGDLRKPDPGLEDSASSWDHYAESSGFGWQELLRSRRILLISEAGAGKTFECEQQASLLFDAGEPAFFLALERVASAGVRTLLYGPSLKRFESWLDSSSQVGYFFLDSIDELQLVHGSFREALKRLAYELEGALGRAVIAVTSRPVAIDRRAFKDILPVPTPIYENANGEDFVRRAIEGSTLVDQDQAPAFREVELLPLTDAQILEFAGEKGVASPQSMLSAIDAKQARDFARRPQDLIELCDDWRHHGRIRSHFEQIKSHVMARLVARPDRREKAELSFEKASEGAQRLALAVTLCRRQTIRYSAGADADGSGESPLDPRLLLQGWRPNEISTLLERPIFAEGGYGRVRFHHRSVTEFLSAFLIHELLQAGTIAVSTAKRLLFGSADTKVTLLKPTMQPIAGWLSLLRSDIFDAVIDIEPSTLLNFGDPESLNDRQRERALLAYVSRYGRGKWRGLNVPNLQVARLANNALSDAILEAWNDGVQNPEVRELLLRLVAAGPLRKCADLAATVAGDASANDRERFESLIALTRIGDARATAFVEAAVTIEQGWTERLGRWVVTTLCPEHVSESQLLKLLVNIRTGKEVDDLARSVAQIIEKSDLSRSRLEALLPGLLALTRSRLSVKDEEFVELVDREKRGSTSSVLMALCIRLLALGSTSSQLLQASVLAARAVSGTSLREDGRGLRVQLDSLAVGLRRQIFEADLEIVGALEKGQRHPYARLFYEGPLNYVHEKDLPWVIASLSDAESTAERREMLLQVALRLALIGTQREADHGAIQGAIVDSTSLLEKYQIAVEASKPSERWLRMQDDERERQERQRRKTEDTKKDWLNFWNEVANKSPLAFAPGRRDSTIWNLWLVLRKAQAHGDDGRWDRAFLEAQFGSQVTNVLRQALMSYWRSMTPTLRSERPAGEKGTYLVVWSIGLMGIYAESEDPSWIRNLTEAEAALAARYSLLELNGLPRWLTALADSHATAIEGVVGADLDDELDDPAIDGHWHSSLLQALRQSPKAVGKLLQPRLLKWLNGDGKILMNAPHSKNNERKLHQVIEVLASTGEQAIHRLLEELAFAQVAAAAHGPYLLFWLPVLFDLNSARSIAKLLEIVEPLPVEKDGVAVHIFGSIFNRTRMESSKSWATDLSANLLFSLTVAISRHVGREEDLVHNGVYSPALRDYAEDGRRHVFDALMLASGPEAMRAKLKLAEEPLFKDSSDRIAALAEERLAAEVDAGVAGVEEVAAFYQGRDLVPKTGADMAQMLADRLEDLQELMLRDTGPRAAWALVDDENSLRPAIAHEFERAARNAYTVDQEAVTADSKETDIRLRCVSGVQATIELKIGEKPRSGKELRDSIEDQLVTKYMAHKMARTGCLVVTVADPTKRWKDPETRALIDRHGLQLLLDRAASAAQLRLGGDARVMARVLDLTPRLQSEAGLAAQAANLKPPS